MTLEFGFLPLPYSHDKSVPHWRELAEGLNSPATGRSMLDEEVLELGTSSLQLSAEGVLALRLLTGYATQAGLPAVLLSAFIATLNRHGSPDDCLVGVSSNLGDSEQPKRGNRAIIPVRVIIDSSLSLLELLRLVDGDLADGPSAGSCPRDLLATCEGDASEAAPPVSRLDYVLTITDGTQPDLCAADCVNCGGACAQAPGIELIVRTSGDSVKLWLQFRADAINRNAAGFLLGRLQALAIESARNIDTPIGELDLRTDEDRRIVIEANQTDSQEPALARLPELIQKVAAAAPSEVAVVDGIERSSYAQLFAAAAAVRDEVILHGGAGTIVGLAGARSAGLAAAVLGIWAAGAAFVPLDPSHPTNRLVFQLDEVGSRLVFGDSAHLGHNRVIRPLPVPTDFASDSDAVSLLAVTSEDLAYVIFTSGSTGRPKGVRVSHRNLTNLIQHFGQSFEFGPRDNALWMTTFSFDISLLELLLPLAHGGSVVVASDDLRLNPELLLTSISREDVKLVQATPTVWGISAPGLRGAMKGRLVLSGGEPLTTAVAADLKATEARVFNVYGPTETTIWSSAAELTGDRIHVGSPIANTRMYVFHGGVQQPVGLVGELCIAGDGVALGYHDRPELTSERFKHDPELGLLYLTGDLARWTFDGTVEVIGRLDRQIKLRGHRIELGEIESVLREHPGVDNAAVVLRGDPTKDGFLAAFVVSSLDSSHVEDLRDHTAKRLPHYSVPSRVILVSELPTTRNGKLDLSALVATPLPELEVVTATEAKPTDDLATALSALWARYLGRAPKSREENFFQAGGTSLAAALFAAQARAELHVDISVSAVLSSPSVAALVKLIGESRTEEPIEPTPDRNMGSLAPGQNRIWMMNRLRPADAAYNLPTVLELHGALNLMALQQSLDRILLRHDALRSVFGADDSGPFQRVTAPAPVPFEVMDVLYADAARMREDVTNRPFDLSADTLLRASVLRYSPTRFDLILVTHHIAFDGWSERILLDELGLGYTQALDEDLADEKLPDVRYIDVSAWQEERVAGPVGLGQRAYWRKQLEDLPAPLDLPSRQSSNGTGIAGHESVDFSSGLSNQVRSVAHAHNTTPHVLMLAAFGMMLSRWSGQSDLVIGSPLGDRDRIELQRLIGFLVTTLPLRLSVARETTFASLLSHTHSVLAEATANSDIPFDRIVHDLGRSGAAGASNPIFRTWFNWLGTPPDAPDLRGLEVELIPQVAPRALFDLSLYVSERHDRYSVEIVHDVDVLDRAHMVEFLEQYRLLVTQLAANPEGKLHEFSLLSRGTQAVAPSGSEDLRIQRPPMLDLLVSAKTAFADRLAVKSSELELTFQALFDRAGAISSRLDREGVRSGDVVPVYADRTIDLIPALLGIIGVGATFCILDSTYPPDRHLLQLSALAPATGLKLTELPRALDDSCEVWLSTESPSPGSWPIVEIEASLAYINFTSGTTGRPQGVRGTWGPIVNFLSWYASRFGIDESDRFAMLSGLSHDPILRDIFTPIVTGATLCVPSPTTRFTPVELLKWLATERITILHVTPTLCRMIAASNPTRPLRHIRLISSGGDRLSAADLVQIRVWAPDAVIINAYGTTETPQMASFWQSEPTYASAEHLPIGSGAPGSELLVRSSEGRPAGIGEVGAVIVRSAFLSDGYLSGEGNSGRFGPDAVPGHRQFSTGDLGRYTPEGLVSTLGRTDNQVKIRGFRIELAEVERSLRAHPSITDAVVGVGDGSTGERQLNALVVSLDNTAIDEAEVRRWVKRSLPDYMVPTSIVTVQSIPMTSNGKIDRSKINATPSRLRPLGRLRTNMTPTEQRVMTIWQAALGGDGFDKDTNFFDAGGSSMLIVRVQADLERTFGREIPITDLFEHSTVRELAHALEIANANSPAASPNPKSSGRTDLRARRLAARNSARPKEPKNG